MPKQRQAKEDMKVVNVLQPTHIHMAVVLATRGQPSPLLVTWKGQKTGREVGRIEPVGRLS